MKKFFLIFSFCALLIGCLGERGITEVGNPSTSPSKLQVAHGVVAVLSDGAVGSLFSLTGAETIEEQEGFECSFNETERAITCFCQLGGTIRKTFQGELPSTNGELSFSHALTETYDQCVISACGEEIELNGSYESVFIGTYEEASDSGHLRIIHQTEEATAGMMAGDVGFGFEITLTLEGINDQTLEGTLSFSDQTFTFENLEELQSQIDPLGECSDEFLSSQEQENEGSEAGTEEGDFSDPCFDCVQLCQSEGGYTDQECINQCQETAQCE